MAKSKELVKTWDYDQSVAEVRSIVERWKRDSVELLEKLWRAREALSRTGAAGHEANLSGTDGPLRTWAGYCEDVGLTKRTANRWLAGYDHETKQLVTPDDDTEDGEGEEESQHKDYWTVEEWNSLRAPEKREILAAAETRDRPMNRVNENIEWAEWSWNPVTGCHHDCAYCYARDIANRYYEQGFEPVFHPARLSDPDNTSVGAPRFSPVGARNVFVCSMADLFGKWVPKDWIDHVLKTVKRNKEWTFLFLTKFPIRMAEFSYPPNVWLGTTVDRQHMVERAEKAFRAIKGSGFGGTCWLSCEPMLEPLTFSSLDMFDWVVMGGSSRSTQTPEYLPPFEDIVHLHNQVRESGCMVYQKTNLIRGMQDTQRVREYPEMETPAVGAGV